MPIVSSFGAVQAWTTPPAPATFYGTSTAGALHLYTASCQTYAAIYRTQPNVRTVVDFLARNIAQLGIHVFRRIADDDRERLADHPLARLLAKPNPAKSRYRMIEDLIADLAIYFRAYWVKVRSADRLGLVRLPPAQIEVRGGLLPNEFVWTLPTGEPRSFAPSEIVHFNGFNPDTALDGLSPLETLRRILAEEAAAGDYREYFWRNHARVDGVIKRPREAGTWKQEQVQAFREQWQDRYVGASGSGKVPVLQDGMEFQQLSANARDSEFVAGRKLTREECAAAYHVPLPMVGILEHATFSNIKEQHKHLYQDCLGPWLEMVDQEFERQLLPEFEDTENVYVEFNIAEKLKGSFEEQAAALQTLVGRPVMTVNEGRARLNLSRKPEPENDQVAQPLNMSTGAEPKPAPPDATERSAAIITATRMRHQARLHKLPPAQRAAAFLADLDRWNQELAADLAAVVGPEDAARLAEAANAQALAELQQLYLVEQAEGAPN